jgi:hypothetical protein
MVMNLVQPIGHEFLLQISCSSVGSTVVGKLCVSAFNDNTDSNSFSSVKSGLSALLVQIVTFGPLTKATLSL